jgi:DNA-binding Lrp family transcriptional regulator
MKDSLLERDDIGLLEVLLRDSRTSRENIAEVTGIASKDVEVRTEKMFKEKVIRSMTTKPGLNSLGAKNVLVYGKSRMRSVEQAVAQLKGNDSVAWIAQSTGGRFYISLHLKKSEDIDAAVRAVERDAMMLRPVAAIRDLIDIMGPYKYSALDWKIIFSLREDPRKDMHDVAVELGVAQGKVEARFKKMLEWGALDFSIDLDMSTFSNPLCIFHTESLDPGSAESDAEGLIKKHSPSILFFSSYSNMRQMMTATALAQDFEEVRAITRSFQELESFAYIEADPILWSVSLKTWRDKMIEKKGGMVLGK